MDFTVPGRLAGFVAAVVVAELPDFVTVATVSGGVVITAGVDETGAVATESAFDPAPG